MQKRKKIGSKGSLQGVKRSKPPSHMEKLLSEIAVFKKKIEIDDQENRLGPSNKVNFPEHNSLYFNTNFLKIIGKDPEGDSESPNSDEDLDAHSFRSKIAKNEAAMNKP